MGASAPFFMADRAVQARRRWALLRLFSKKSAGLRWTQVTNLSTSGCVSKACGVLNCRASSFSDKSAWICRWQMRCSNWVSRPPLDLGTKWCASCSAGGISRPHNGQTGSTSDWGAKSSAHLCCRLILPNTRSPWRQGSGRRRLATLGRAAAGVRAVFDLVPILGPGFAPGHGPLALLAGFAGQVGFVALEAWGHAQAFKRAKPLPVWPWAWRQIGTAETPSWAPPAAKVAPRA